MRIIKFRGKSLNTKMWVYGDLNHRGKRTFIEYEVDCKTIGQFIDEIMPVDINLLQQEINEGYIMLSDGRYLPPKEAVQQCYNAFGIRVGLGDNWEDIYDGWNKEMK